ncbi:DNA translocase FtsK 4TM domain-containing protein [bacterium]|nr:DNA translocase FtsK 4TM domain-containing protein [bacterium]
MAPSRKKQSLFASSIAWEVIALGIGVVALFLSLALISFYFSRHTFYGYQIPQLMGRVGAFVAASLDATIGYGSIFIALGFWSLVDAAIDKYREPQDELLLSFRRRFSLWSILSLTISVIAGAFLAQGGFLGNYFAGLFVPAFETTGVALIFGTITAYTLFTLIRPRLNFESAEEAEDSFGETSLFADATYFTWESLRFVWKCFWGIFRSIGNSVSFLLSRETSQLEPVDWHFGDAAIDAKVAPSIKIKKRSNADEFDDQQDFDWDADEDAPPIKVSRHYAAEIQQKTTKSKALLKKKPPLKSKLKATTKDVKARTVSYANYSAPSLDLLTGAIEHSEGPSDEELMRNSKRLEKALQDFKIGGRIIEVQPGPVITLYEFEPAPGVKVQRVINVADDLALALRAPSVRIYAPVPGKSTVGIEVPNSSRDIVRLKEVLASDDFQSSESLLTLALGKDTFGNPYVADLSRMPHLLIAGATGTGKSVCLNAMLLSLLYRNSPRDMKLIMIDPKMLELSLYEGIAHLKAPVVTNPKRARGVLWWAVEEMDRRYALMKEMGVRNLAGYNKLALGNDAPDESAEPDDSSIINLTENEVLESSAGLLGAAELPSTGKVKLTSPGAQILEPLPRIVIVVDELADLMLTVGREVEELFTRLAQKARAAGIHLILATQRPSVNVITGLIKANFPARISFKVATKIDSRTVLDTSGSEQLLGEGDMLFLSPITGRMKRLHGAFVSDEEVQQVVQFVKSQGAPDYDPAIDAMIKRIEESESGGGSFGGEGESEEFDPLYDKAVQLVVEKGMASTSLVQRVFRIGYNRAARIIESMEREGVVGPADGAKPRQVFVANRE